MRLLASLLGDLIDNSENFLQSYTLVWNSVYDEFESSRMIRLAMKQHIYCVYFAMLLKTLT